MVAVLPTLLTVVILVKGYQFTDQYVGTYINGGVRWASAQVLAYLEVKGTPRGSKDPTSKKTLDNNEWQDKLEGIWRYNWYPNLVGIACAIILFYLLGYFLASIIGRSTWRLLEAPFVRFPLVKAIYPHVKTVTNFLFSEHRLDYSRVVAVEYPRKGIWSLGLVTGTGFEQVAAMTGRQYVSIFIPSSPTPITGYVITVPRDEIVDLPFTIDEALRFTVSAGVIHLGDDAKADGLEGAASLPADLQGPAPEALGDSPAR